MSEINNLPNWDEMSDRDRGAAVAHVRARDDEGAEYAVEHYPCRYVDHPALVALATEERCAHALDVTGGDETIADFLGWDEYRRLHEIGVSS